MRCGGEHLGLGDRGRRICAPTLLFNMSLLIFDKGRGLALRIRAAVRSLFLAMAAAER